VKVKKDMLDVAKHILKTKKTKFDPSKFEDRYERALKALIAAKQAGKKPPTPPTPQPTNVVSLMDALRRSVQAERGGAATERGRGKAQKRAAAKSTALKRAPARRKKLKRAS
jgi:DNA end-binding protein Ku